METKICKTCGRELSVENFKKTRWGDRVNVCTECAVKKMRENKSRKEAEMVQEKIRVRRETEERRSVLESYTARELMEELARRGYRGELTYVHKIDITNF